MQPKHVIFVAGAVAVTLSAVWLGMPLAALLLLACPVMMLLMMSMMPGMHGGHRGHRGADQASPDRDAHRPAR